MWSSFSMITPANARRLRSRARRMRIDAAPAPAPSTTCGAPANPWGYNFCGNGTRVRTPDPSLCSYFQCIPSFWKQTNEYVAQCRDGLLSHSGGVSGACSGHHGEAQPLYGP